jgi:anti-sigma regulatory factor (Ser/Thr protein kinase)
VSGGQFSEIELTVPAEAAYLKDLRRLVETFGSDCGATEEQIMDMVLATNEACGNVVVHAYGDQRGPLRLRAWGVQEALVIEVSDNGTPVAKPLDGRIGGLGLDLIRQVCADVDIEGPGEYGTRLEMTFKLAPDTAGDT